MDIKIGEENFEIEDSRKGFQFPMGALMLSHCDLNYLKPGDSRMILHRYIPRELRLNNILLQTNHFGTLRENFRNAAAKTKDIIRKRTENSLIFPCHRFNRIPYTTVTEDLLRRCLLLQEEINQKIAVIPKFRSQLSVRRFRRIENMFNGILLSTEKLKGAFLPSGFLRNSDYLTVLGQSELDFFFLSAQGINYRYLANFYERLERLLSLEKPVFVTDAVLFTEDTLFAPRLADTGVCGYSLPFVDYYIPPGPTYYDVLTAVNGRHKTHEIMVRQYGSNDFPLSEICRCSICEENTVGTFFFGSDLAPHEKNRLHKLEFTEISSSEEGSRPAAKAVVP